MRNINNALRKNRRVIKMLLSRHIKPVSQQLLSDSGFNFNYYTHAEVNPEGEMCFYCYDYGYLRIKNTCILIKIESSSIDSL